MNAENTDILVIGSGVAGLVFALTCAERYDVTLLCKASLYDTNTSRAQGGIAAALKAPDCPGLHLLDTLEAGAGLCNERAVEFLVNQAADAIRFLTEAGMPFQINSSQVADLALEGGHSRARVMHVHDHTGKSLMETLSHHVRRHPRIHIRQHCQAIRLLADDGQCSGVEYLSDGAGQSDFIHAQITLLAAGGAGQLFETNTNSKVATGDGFALAYEAGARLKDMEFIQFHPTLLYSKPQENPFLISEALRGAGAVLCDAGGRRFMDGLHPLGSLAPRDIVSRSIFREMHHSGAPCVYLDIRHGWNCELENHFSSIHAEFRNRGIHPAHDLIPVIPAAHYFCGGIETDLYGQTSMPGLLAAGENACTGVHGANRLASNSLLEGVVFSLSAGRYLLEHGLDPSPVRGETRPRKTGSEPGAEAEITRIRKKLRTLMWERAGIRRNEEGLCEVLLFLEKSLHSPAMDPGAVLFPARIELRQMLLTAKLVVTAALERKESRGTHFREDTIAKLLETCQC